MLLDISMDRGKIMALHLARERAVSWPRVAVRIPHLPPMAYAETGRRDLRLDFLRGIAVSMMVLDHVGGSTVLTQITGGNRSIVSAAEAFVFLSGLISGMVYGEKLRTAGPRAAVSALLFRAGTLYRASLLVTLPFLALYLGSSVRLWVDRSAGLGAPDAGKAVLGALTLHYSFNGSDVLVMYALMMALAPAVLYALSKGLTPLVLGISAVLWAAYQVPASPFLVPWPVANSSFPVQTWQLLFIAGMSAGYHRDRPLAWLYCRRGHAPLVVLGMVGLMWLLLLSNQLMAAHVLPSWLGGSTYGALFSKSSLGIGRILAFSASATIAFALIHHLWVPARRALGWLLLPLGQNSLYVYVAHLFMVVFVYNEMGTMFTLLAPLSYSFDVQVLVNLESQILTLATMWVAVRWRILFRVIPH